MKLPEIPSGYIEPYLSKFMGSMVEYVASAKTEEQLKKDNGIGWTVADIKKWVKGVEVFVSLTCGIHARMAMMNEMYKFSEMEDKELYKTCRKVVMESFEEDV